MATPMKSEGIAIKIGDGGSPETFSEITGAHNFSGLGMEMEPIETTDFSNSIRSYIGGLKKGGTLSFDIFYDPDDTVHQQVINDFNNRVERNFQIVFTDAVPTTFEFSALITKYDIGAGLNEAVVMSVDLQLTGAPTIS